MLVPLIISCINVGNADHYPEITVFTFLKTIVASRQKIHLITPISSKHYSQSLEYTFNYNVTLQFAHAKS